MFNLVIFVNNLIFVKQREILMLNIFVNFKNDTHGYVEPMFVQGKDWEDVENKMSKFFDEKENDMHVTYFNFMIIDSDFQRDYDAEISIHFDYNDGVGSIQRNYKVDFCVVNNIIS